MIIPGKKKIYCSYTEQICWDSFEMINVLAVFLNLAIDASNTQVVKTLSELRFVKF